MLCGDKVINLLSTFPGSVFKLFLIFFPLLTFIAIFIIVIKKFRNNLLRIVISFIGLPVFLVMTFIFWLIYGYFFEGEGSARASRYFQMNAAIKNTCYLDPKMVNCPHDLQGLLNLYPEDFNPVNKDSKLTYRYYPDTNEYTLIVRDRFEGAVIFDPRLSTIEHGFDFKEVSVNTCGPDRIANPPSFPGPWNEIGEWYKFY